MTQSSQTTSPGAQRTALLVLGMHRSGTSLLGSLVESLGVDMGEDLYPADEHNPAGYFEDRACVDIQDRILAALGQQPWHGAKGMAPFAPQWWRRPEMAALVAELEQWLDRRIWTSTTIWGMKDPRTTRFLPLWNELLTKRGIQPRYVLAVRDPAEVVASIRARDGAQAEHVYRTWLRFNMEALMHAGDRLQGVFAYERWFDDGAAQLQQLGRVVDQSLEADEALQLLRTCLRDDLYRQKERGAQAPAWAAAFYARLKALGSPCAADEVAALATEAEYLDALLRQGSAAPSSDAPLHALLCDGPASGGSLELARELRDAGNRVVLAVDGELPDWEPLAGIAVVQRGAVGPEVGGFERSRQAYLAWCWLAARFYAHVHIEGGMGLAAHLVDARMQGWPDRHGGLDVHYLAPPSWLQADGSVQLRGVAEAEAVCLERRVFASATLSSLRGKPALLASLRRALRVNVTEAALQMSAISSEPPLVSVCITHFNRPDLLDDCLQSVRQQDYAPYEVVLVDDGSSQPSALAYLDALQPEFHAKGWTLIRQENRYLGAARNTALRAARGEYVFILDDDNLLMSNGLRHAVQVAERTGADVVTAVMALFSGSAGTQPRWPDHVWPHAGNCLLHGALENNVGDANALLRRQSVMALGGFTEERGVGAEDWELYLKALLAGLRTEHSLMPFSWYRVDASSMSRAGNWWRDYRRAIRPVEACLPEGLKELPALTNLLLRSVRELESVAAQLPGLHDRLNSAQDMLAQTQQALVQTRLELAQKQQECAAVYRSRSWRATAPLRRAGAVLRLLGLDRLFRSAKRIFR